MSLDPRSAPTPTALTVSLTRRQRRARSGSPAQEGTQEYALGVGWARRAGRAPGVVVAAAVLGASLFVIVPVASAKSMWIPTQGLRWQYQLQGKLKTNLCVVPKSGGACVRPNVYDVDLYAPDGVTPNTAAVAAIHAIGAHAVCYVDAGTWEDFRPDAGAVPRVGQGPAQRLARGALARHQGHRGPACPSSPPGWRSAQRPASTLWTSTTSTGTPTRRDSRSPPPNSSPSTRISPPSPTPMACRWASRTTSTSWASSRARFDFAVNEQCAQFNECDAYDGWTAAGKAVVEVEYRAKPAPLLPERRPCTDATPCRRAWP